MTKTGIEKRLALKLLNIQANQQTKYRVSWISNQILKKACRTYATAEYYQELHAFTGLNVGKRVIDIYKIRWCLEHEAEFKFEYVL